MVCRLGIDLQTPADLFHFFYFFCSLCASLSLWVRSDITRATWVDDWWCPLVNIASYMCHQPKEPMPWTSFPLFFLNSPSYSLLALFSSFLPSSSYLLPLLQPHPLIFFSLSALLSSSIYPPYGCFHIFAVERGMRPSLFFLLLCAPLKTVSRGWVENVKH